MANLLEKISSQLDSAGLARRSRESRAWLNQKIQSLRSPNRNALLRDKDKKVERVYPGRMYFFSYDPKLKDTLPFYDRFPLVFPLEMYNDGILGMNLHYIPPNQRLILLSKLYSTANNKKFDETTKLRISYEVLNGASRFELFKPCIKRYLGSHVVSNIIEIPSSDWEIAAVLPYDMFINATREEVYRNSKGI